MERRYKDGVDYWNLDVDFFDNKKIRLIRGEFGIKGVYIHILILNEIYRTCGYYKKWDSDDCLLMSDYLGVAGDRGPNLIAEVVQGLVRRSLFDQGVLDRFGVLTSAEIQRRFLRIVGNSRESIPIIKEYFLLETSNRKDVTEATLGKITFLSVSGKDSAQNLKVKPENLKDLDKEQKRTEQKRTVSPHTPQGVKTDGIPRYKPEWFSRFWNLYPRHTKKAETIKAWDKLKPNRELCDVMSAAIRAQMQTEQWRRDGGRFIPHPSSWLNGRRWEDEISQTAQPAESDRSFSLDEIRELMEKNSGGDTE